MIYITGNHDEMLRRYSDVEMGNFKLTDKVVMEIDGKMTWIFHGDVFDATTKGSAKMLAKLGGHGYDLLILLNRFINYFLRLAGKEKMSLSKKVKASVKQAVSWIGNFEQTAAELAISKKYDYVICGHIHQPQVRTVETEEGKVVYMNSGDWVENLTALEYNQHEWMVYQYDPKFFVAVDEERAGQNTTTPTINVCPSSTTTYTAEITYTLCDGRTIKETDETTVTINGAKVWNGSVNTDWNVANNWTPTGIPTALDCVVIADTANDPIISGTNYNGLGLNLTIDNNAVLTVNTNNFLFFTLEKMAKDLGKVS